MEIYPSPHSLPSISAPVQSLSTQTQGLDTSQPLLPKPAVGFKNSPLSQPKTPGPWIRGENPTPRWGIIIPESSCLHGLKVPEQRTPGLPKAEWQLIRNQIELEGQADKGQPLTSSPVSCPLPPSLSCRTELIKCDLRLVISTLEPQFPCLSAPPHHVTESLQAVRGERAGQPHLSCLC